MVDFVTAFATASQALKLVQDLRGIEKAFDAAELKLKIADLTGALADLKMTLTEARDEIQSKKEEIKFLEEQLLLVAETIEANGYKYRKGLDGTPAGHAFCPVCQQKEGMLIQLVTGPERNEFCPNCKGAFGHVSVYSTE